MTRIIFREPVKSMITIFALCVSAGLFAVLALEVVLEKEDWFDTKVFTFLHGIASPVSTRFFEFMTNLGSGYFITTAYVIVLLLLLWRKRRADALVIGITAITASLLVAGLKVLFARARPDAPLISELSTYSFPSGHTVSSFVFFGLMAWECSRLRIPRTWKIMLIACCLLLAILVGISRIVLRYHFASDVAGGWCLGTVILCIFLLVRQRITGRQVAEA
jgi:undecaprenyl-diphosphatase